MTPLSTCIMREDLLRSIPRVLCLLDKNPLSNTYGCLDRKYWLYKIIDFPSGMQQELARVLAWAWADTGADNRWGANARLRQYALAAIRYYVASMHPDGSLDDYFPWERALGATAYATAAVTDACSLLGWTPDTQTRDALQRAGRFMVSHVEAGMLANHHAIAAAALLGIARTTGEASFNGLARQKIAFLCGLQHPDGWFPEYEGCDIGYQTVTLEFLARCEQMQPGVVPEDMLERLTCFVRSFAHPDGSLGGEYASRNTYNFYPGGPALLSARSDAAAELLGLYLRGVERNTANHLEDDGTFGHILSSMVTALSAPGARILEPSPVAPGAPFVRVFDGCALYTAGTGDLRLFGNLTKGGCFKLFRADRLICSDTGFAGELEDGTLFCQNNPRSSSGTATLSDNAAASVSVQGDMRPYRTKRLSQPAMIVLRLLCFAFGRLPWFSRGIRKLMQAVLIYQKNTAPVSFRRDIRLDGQGIDIQDAVACSGTATFSRLLLTTDFVNMHVVTSESFQSANLTDWQECAPETPDRFELRRSFRSARRERSTQEVSPSPAGD